MDITFFDYLRDLFRLPSTLHISLWFLYFISSSLHGFLGSYSFPCPTSWPLQAAHRQFFALVLEFLRHFHRWTFTFFYHCITSTNQLLFCVDLWLVNHSTRTHINSILILLLEVLRHHSSNQVIRKHWAHRFLRHAQFLFAFLQIGGLLSRWVRWKRWIDWFPWISSFQFINVFSFTLRRVFKVYDILLVMKNVKLCFFIQQFVLHKYFQILQSFDYFDYI